MKRLLLILALLVMVVGVQGLALDFQNPSDFSAQVTCPYSSCSWTHSATGGNSYITVVENGEILSQTPLVMTYAAATTISGPYNWYAYPRDGAGVSYGFSILGCAGSSQRMEFIVSGGTATVYCNGVYSDSRAVSSNPSYVGFAYGSLFLDTGDIDDIIWGSTESKYIFGMPENGYFLMKDILNPASSGFYRVNQTVANGSPTLIASTSMTSTFGKGSGTNETVELFSQSGGTKQNYYTGTAYAGSISWNLTALFASDMQYGLVQSTIHDQVPNTAPYVVSDTIPYIGSGASIQFDKNSYAIGETAILTVVVSDSYYNTTTYSYHVVIQDIYGTEVYDAPISFSASPHTGTANYQWATTDNEGVYYGLIYAKRISDNVELLMNYDTADLNSNLVVNGYVFDAQNATVLSGALVNVTQGTTTDSLTSAADGNYSSTSAFSANQPTTIVASKTGYETYQHVFTPLYAGSIQINLTLMPTSPTFSGVALGGIARTPPYNRTIDSATITITNANATYTVTTNSAGYYIKNYMRPNEWWNVIGSKTGFGNSSTYNKLVVGI
jgi:hypothetical protein